MVWRAGARCSSETRSAAATLPPSISHGIRVLQRDVAVKLLGDTGRSAEIIQEARLLARVRHPNVVTVYGVDQHDGVVGLWMEFVDGLTLTRVLATRGVLGPREAALIGIDLCRAVAAVHKAGLVHRDIKAQNVMREAGGRIVLMDFGAGEMRADRTPSGRVTGTPLYLAPSSSTVPSPLLRATSTAWVCCCSIS